MIYHFCMFYQKPIMSNEVRLVKTHTERWWKKNVMSNRKTTRSNDGRDKNGNKKIYFQHFHDHFCRVIKVTTSSSPVLKMFAKILIFSSKIFKNYARVLRPPNVKGHSPSIFFSTELEAQIFGLNLLYKYFFLWL